MAIQFVGSKSLDDRRRRRLAVNGDGALAESTPPEEGASRVESELVMSAAAAPWVPAYEWRIWTYGAMLGLPLIAVSFALARPSAFRPELAPLTKHLLEGSRPVLASVIQTMFWFLCAQLAILISWYRAQCKLDFNGRYRVWPWTAAFCGLAAFCSATNAHVFFGEIVTQGEWLAWRSETVAWLLPTCMAAIPLTVLLDRDVRRGRTTVYTLRTAWFLGLTTAVWNCLHPTSKSSSGIPPFDPSCRCSLVRHCSWDSGCTRESWRSSAPILPNVMNPAPLHSYSVQADGALS